MEWRSSAKELQQQQKLTERNTVQVKIRNRKEQYVKQNMEGTDTGRLVRALCQLYLKVIKLN